MPILLIFSSFYYKAKDNILLDIDKINDNIIEINSSDNNNNEEKILCQQMEIDG